MMLPKPADVRCRPCARKPCNATFPSQHKAVLLSLCRPCWALKWSGRMSMMMLRKPRDTWYRPGAGKSSMEGILSEAARVSLTLPLATSLIFPENSRDVVLGRTWGYILHAPKEACKAVCFL